MSSYVTAFNGTSSPLHIDRAGRVLGAGEWGPVRSDDWPAKGLIADGKLVVVERPAGVDDSELNPDAVRAFEATAAAAAAANAAGQADASPAPTKEG